MKIQSDPLQVYRDIASQFMRARSSAMTDGGKLRENNSSVSADAEIGGASFLDYLSGAERKFLSEVFAANTRRSTRGANASAARTLGRNLDVKA